MPPRRYVSADKPARCPQCGAAKVVPILYGMPGLEARDAELRGELVIGGCVLMGEGLDPAWQCIACSVQVYPRTARKRRRG